jgi:hypothetical protein
MKNQVKHQSQKARGAFALTLAVMSLVASTTANAQSTVLPEEGSDKEDQGFVEFGVKTVPLPKNRATEFANINKAGEDTTSGISGMAEAMLDDEEGSSVAKSMAYLDPTETDSQALQLQPNLGVAQLMGSSAFTSNFNESVGSSSMVTAYAATMGQTSPALLAASKAGMELASDQVGRQYQALDAFYKQLEFLKPWARKQILASFQACVHKQIYSDQPWVKAVQTCSGDVMTKEAFESGSTYTEEDGEKDTKGDEAMWSISKHHSLRSDEKMAISFKLNGEHGESDRQFIQRDEDDEGTSLADEIFAPLVAAAREKGDGEEEQKVFTLYQNWIEMFGDIEFVADIDERSSIYKRSSTKFTIKRVPPTLTPGEMVASMAKRRYEKLIEIVGDYCRFQQDVMEYSKSDPEALANTSTNYWTSKNGVTPFSNAISIPRAPSQGAQPAVGTEKLQEIARVLSVEGYQFNQALLELLFGRFSRDNVVTISYIDNVCKSIEDKKNQSTVKDGGQDQATLTLYNNYAKIIAYGQLLSAYKQATTFLMQRTSEPGNDELNMREIGIKLINDTARTTDLMQAQTDNLEALRTFVEKLYQERSSRSGGGNVLATTIAANAGRGDSSAVMKR